MRATVAMWWLLRRRSAGRADPQGLATVLAVVAFATTTAVLLVVLGGLGAFLDRAAAAPLSPGDDTASNYTVLAGTATALLAVPLLTLGGAASRLAVARRDTRLAALRLAGATTAQVSLLTVLDSAAQAVAGALIGVAGYLALLPAVMQLRFQGRPFALVELLVPWWLVLAAVAGVVAVALASAGTSLRSVAISPLGVAARVAPNGLHWSRLLPLVGTATAFAVMYSVGLGGLAVLIGLVVAGFVTLNIVGPFVMSLVGRVALRRARGPATLIAARRVLDSPTTAWRSVGGVALATFVAGLTSAIAMFDGGRSADPAQVEFFADLATGGFLTLGIAGLLAAVSTAVMQAGRVIDQRGEYRALHLAGTDLRVLDAARVLETTIPLLAAVGLAGAAASVFLLPALGMTLLTSVPVLLRFLLCVVAAVALVLAGTRTSRRVVRTVLV